MHSEPAQLFQQKFWQSEVLQTDAVAISSPGCDHESIEIEADAMIAADNSIFNDHKDLSGSASAGETEVWRYYLKKLFLMTENLR